jgi:sulfonate dioxygenase
MAMAAPIPYDINIPYSLTAEKVKLETSTPYPFYLPSFDKIWFDPLPEFPFTDPALRADKSFRSLLAPSATTTHITPKMGTILRGVEISGLSDAAKDELALLVSQRKVVVLPDQECFLKAGPEKQQDFMAYFGKPNYQPVSASIKGYPGFHIIHRDGNKEETKLFFGKKLTSTLWHQDVSYEKQPPGYVMLGILQCPEVGGDTVFAATDEAYKCVRDTLYSRACWSDDAGRGAWCAGDSHRCFGLSWTTSRCTTRLTI